MAFVAAAAGDAAVVARRAVLRVVVPLDDEAAADRRVDVATGSALVAEVALSWALAEVNALVVVDALVVVGAAPEPLDDDTTATEALDAVV